MGSWVMVSVFIVVVVGEMVVVMYAGFLKYVFRPAFTYLAYLYTFSMHMMLDYCGSNL